MARLSSFFVKIFSGFFITIILLMGLTLFTTFNVMKMKYINILKGELEKLNLALYDQTVEFFNQDNIDDFIKEKGEKLQVRITIVDTSGLVLADSEHEPEKMENHKNREEIRYAFNTEKTGTSLRYSSTLNHEMLYVAQALEKNGEVIGVIRSSMFLENINDMLTDLRKKLIRASFFVFLFSLFVAMFISRSFSNPVTTLKEAALKVSNGDFQTRVDIKSKGDFRTFANSFNEMTERIQNLFTRVENEKETLNCLLESIREGILVIDQQGKIILANPEMNNITGRKLVGLYYRDVFKEKYFKNSVEKVQNNKKVSMEAIKWNQKDFIFSLSKVAAKGDIIFSLKNITDMKELEQIKKDFVSNVSHELRTPLTAIKGFVETLQDEETDEMKKHYFEILEKHTDRLINIVKDLLALSNLESSRSKLDIEKINIEQLVADVEKVVDVKIKAKGLVFYTDLDQQAEKIDGDRFKLEQLLINLIDNAAKYTDEGKISVITKKKNDHIQIRINDTGIGIPQKHISRVFERFYVVDKSRSRKMGGTGLGLSIVKHIVMQHHGQLDVKSEKNVGTEFIIDLPISQG